MSEGRTLLRASHAWQAARARKTLAGLVDHELVDGVRYTFDPRINYSDADEPYPWLLVADRGEVIVDELEPVVCERCGR